MVSFRAKWEQHRFPDLNRPFQRPVQSQIEQPCATFTRSLAIVVTRNARVLEASRCEVVVP